MTDYTEKQQRRAVTIQQLANSIIQEQVDKIMISGVMTAINSYLNENGMPETRFQLNQLKKAIDKIITEQMLGGFGEITDIMEEFAVKESAFAYSSLLASGAQLVGELRKPARDMVIDYIAQSVMDVPSGDKVQAGLWQDYVNNYVDSQSKSINQLVQSEWYRGFQDGKILSKSQLTKRVKSYLQNASKNQAEALVITGLSHYSQKASEAFRDDNLDVIDREYPIITFDTGTTVTCLSISAKYGIKGWPVGKSPIGYPPYHYRCRTRIGYMTKGQKEPFGEMNVLSGKKGDGAKEEFLERDKNRRTAYRVKYRGRRDLSLFNPEQLDAATPIAKIMLDQPDWFIKQSLGKKLGQAFIDGKVNLTNLTDKNLMPKTIDEIGIE